MRSSDVDATKLLPGHILFKCVQMLNFIIRKHNLAFGILELIVMCIVSIKNNMNDLLKVFE
jgi:hypothetical protein